MFRRVVSLLLLPYALLPLATAFGHTHGAVCPKGHDSRPHFHFNSEATKPESDFHHHGHRHGPGGRHHHDADAVPPADQPGQSPEFSEPSADHDSDAVYLNGSDVIARGRVETQAAFESSAMCRFVVVSNSAGKHAARHTLAAFGLPPPHLACPIYVRHLALLI
jgi:hypothetical protein